MLSKDYYAYLEEARRKQDALKHYGTKGQKWGVRHWQNYDGTFNEEGKIRYFGKSSSRIAGSKTDEVDFNNPMKYEMDPYLAYLLFEVGINVVLPVAAIGTGLGVSAVHDAAVSHKIKKYEKLRQSEETDPKTGLKIKADQDDTALDDVKTVNLEERYWVFHSDKRKGHTENCMLCTTAMDLKRRGYDAKAGTSDDGYYDTELKKWYKNPKVEKDGLKNIIEKLKKEPEGSYGNFMCIWKFGGGHSMFYRIENGKVAIYDAQTGKYYKDITKTTLYENMWEGNNNVNGTHFCRTDNLEINAKYLKEKGLVE